MAANIRVQHGMLRERREPGRGPAFVLAAMVHAGFAAVLVFGVNWQTRAPAPLQAELWRSLPPVQQVAPEVPKAEPEPPTPPPPEVKPEMKPPPQPNRADIELKEKLEKEKKLKEEQTRRELEEQKKADEKRKLEETRRKEAEDKKRKEDEKKKAEERVKKAAEAKAKAEAEAALLAASRAQQAVLDDWRFKIAALVRNRANVPDSVSGKPVIEIKLKLLVTGVVFEAVVVRRSGNRVYDEAIERAIAGIRQWPTPSDPAVFRNNRELLLKIEHEK